MSLVLESEISSYVQLQVPLFLLGGVYKRAHNTVLHSQRVDFEYGVLPTAYTG